MLLRGRGMPPAREPHKSVIVVLSHTTKRRYIKEGVHAGLSPGNRSHDHTCCRGSPRHRNICVENETPSIVAGQHTAVVVAVVRTQSPVAQQRSAHVHQWRQWYFQAVLVAVRPETVRKRRWQNIYGSLVKYKSVAAVLPSCYWCTHSSSRSKPLRRESYG